MTAKSIMIRQSSDSARPANVAWALLICSLSVPTLLMGANRDWSWAAGLVACSLALLIYVRKLKSDGGSLRKELRTLQLFPSYLGWAILAWLSYVTVLPLLLHFVSGLAMTGNDFISWLRSAGKTIWYLQVFLLTTLMLQSTRRLRLTMQILFVIALFHAIFASVSHLTGESIVSAFFVFNPITASGAFMNRNHFAGYLELHLAMGAGLLMAGLKLQSQGADHWRQMLRDLAQVMLSRKAQIRIALIVMVVALVVSQSRGGNAAFFASLIGVGALACLVMKNRPPALPWLIVSLLLFDLIVIGTWFGADRIAARISATRMEYVGDAALPGERPSVNGQASEDDGETVPPTRLDIDSYSLPPRKVPFTAATPVTALEVNIDRERPAVTAVALALWRQAPIFGHGGDSFRLQFPSLRPTTMGDSFFDHAHNDWAQWLMEYGVVGTFLAATILLLCWRAAWRALRRSKDRFASGAAFACLLGTCSILLHGMVDFNLQIPSNAASFSFLLAVGWLSLYGRLRARQKSRASSDTDRPDVPAVQLRKAQ